MTGSPDVESALAARHAALTNVSAEHWDCASRLWMSGDYASEFLTGFANGLAFLRADAGLRERVPRLIEWTGGRRDPGDGAVPADLRIDHVYLISCKYRSQVLHNRSPARLFEATLTNVPVDEASDWYSRVAPNEHQALYATCASRAIALELPTAVTDLKKPERRALSLLLDEWPDDAIAEYEALCSEVSANSANAWREALADVPGDVMFWRLVRIYQAPYFVLGSDSAGAVRLRVDTPWEWRNKFRFRTFSVGPLSGGQPLVAWRMDCDDLESGLPRHVEGHVQVRWSHRRFGQRPEAKVYLDGPLATVPGYNPL
jgi:hypothetical protein